MSGECVRQPSPANGNGERKRRPFPKDLVSVILSKRLSRGALSFFAPQKRGERLINVKFALAAHCLFHSDKIRKCETMLNL
jgi:hypothetical protein